MIKFEKIDVNYKNRRMANIFTPFPDDKKSNPMISSVPVFLNVSKKILARQSIFRSIDCNVAHDLKRGTSFLTEEQIKMSSIYQKMIQRIQKAKAKQQQEIKQHQKAMERMANEIKYLKSSVQEDKVEMWEAKNEIMELEELLEQEMEQYNALCQQIRAGDEDDQEFDDQEGMQNEDEGYENENYYSGSQISGGQEQLERSNGQQQEQRSRPSCSIKYYISNRSIPSGGESKKNLEMGVGMNMNMNSENVEMEKNEQQIVRESQNTPKQQTVISEENLLSFKKSQSLVWEQRS